jgi:hypothetical protein
VFDGFAAEDRVKSFVGIRKRTTLDVVQQCLDPILVGQFDQGR